MYSCLVNAHIHRVNVLVTGVNTVASYILYDSVYVCKMNTFNTIYKNVQRVRWTTRTYQADNTK